MIIVMALALLAAPPAPVSLALAEMGRGCYACRERGSLRLYLLCETPDRGIADLYRGWAARGISHPDPEVSMRCLRVLRRCEPCRTCQARGISDAAIGWDSAWGQPETAMICRDCKGSGTAWPLPFLDEPFPFKDRP